MKGFITTLILFGLLLGCIVYNSITIGRFCDRMEHGLRTLSDAGGEEDAATLDGLTQRWAETRKWLSFSVSQTEINRIQDDLIALCAYCGNAPADYRAARERLLRALEMLR